jgi:8-oxo-dGTP pyrophosphatase MutT (NUDIX family)
VPWTFEPKPENVTVVPHVQQRVVELAAQSFSRAVRLLREETGLPLDFSVALVQHWTRREP